MPKVDPRDFLLNTDYEMDKIIYFTEVKRTVSSQTTFDIDHKLNTIPLIFGMWSYHSDYSDAHEIGEQTSISGSVFNCYATADYNQIHVTLIPESSNTTFYIRIFAFEPYYSNTGVDFPHTKLPATNKYAQKFILNTDYNYLKLLKVGNFIKWDSTLQCHVYRHKLGYLPQVLDWASLGGGTIQNFRPFYPTADFAYSDSGGFNYKGGLFVTDQEIYRYDGVVPLQHIVRLYCDEA